MLIELTYGGAPAGSAFGSCYLCRTAPEGAWVKTAVDIVGEGELILCATCTRELGRCVGLTDPSETERLRETVQKLTAEIDHLRPLADGFRMFANAYESAREA